MNSDDNNQQFKKLKCSVLSFGLKRIPTGVGIPNKKLRNLYVSDRKRNKKSWI